MPHNFRPLTDDEPRNYACEVPPGIPESRPRRVESARQLDKEEGVVERKNVDYETVQ